MPQDQDKAQIPYIYLLPLPISGGDDGRLGGVIFAHADANLVPVERPQFILCHLAERILPSPGYLFAQGLDPRRLAHGMKDRDFVDAIRKLIQGFEIITWDASLLKLIDVAALRAFRCPNVIDGTKGVCSLRSVLYAANSLGTLPKPPQRSPEKSAYLYNVARRDMSRSPERRLLELEDMAQMIREEHKALFDYQLLGAQHRLSLFNAAINQGKLLACINTEGIASVLRPLKINSDSITTLELEHGAEPNDVANILKKDLSLFDGRVIAPLGVFTKERCDRLELNLEPMVNALLNTDAETINTQENTNDVFKSLLKRLNKIDLEYLYETFQAPNVAEPPAESSGALYERYFFYIGDNERGRFTAQQYKYYENLTRASLTKHINSFVANTNALINHANENSKDDTQLIDAIAGYPLTLG